MLAQWPAALPAATRRIPKNLLPAPGNTGIVLNLLGLRDGRTVVTTGQHPLFESSWKGSTSEIVAHTRYGDVTSADLWLWMMLRESPNKAFLLETYHKSKLPKEREEIAKALKVEIDEYVFTNFVIPKIMPAAPPDAIYDVKHEVYTLPAWQAVFLEKVVQPRVTITEADRQKYLQEHIVDVVEPERLRARYIFMRSPETDPATDQDRVEVDMDELRSSILRGETDFASAARAHSQAPSASNGGEIPPFGKGELFYLFEHNAGSLKPGAISPVFRGPNGFYMVQLIEVLKADEPSLANPEQARLVEEGLSRQVLKAAFDVYMRDMLEERRRITEKVWAWDDLEDCEAVGDVCDYVISKGQFRSAWPGIESNNLKLRTDVIGPQLRAILEREAMAQDVRELGFAGDPMLERARWMAGNIIRRDAWVDRLRASLPLSEELVHNFWKNNPGLFTPMALKRVIRMTLTPSNTVPLPAQTRLELDQVLARAAGEPVTVAVAKREVMDEERDSPVYDNLERTENAFQMMTVPDDQLNFYIGNDNTSETLESLIESKPSTDIPSLGGEPAPNVETISAPDDVTTDTLKSLEDRPNSSGVLDLPTTAPKGGAAPNGASGGLLGSELGGEKILPNIEQSVKPTPTPEPARETDGTVVKPFKTPAPEDINVREADIEAGPVIDDASKVLPAARPVSGAVPVGITAPAIAPAAPLQPTPNIRKQLPPPATSSIPYNPDWFYARREFSQIKKIIGTYSSSDWLLSTEDLGFVYLEDLADAPRELNKVPVGAFSRPIVRGLTAVSWFIEEARTAEKQPYEAIKTHVYDVYRNTQIDKTVSRTYNNELDKADIDYKF